MVRATKYEAIRRGLIILSMMGPVPITAKQIHNRLEDSYGLKIDLRSVQRDLSDLSDIFPNQIEVNFDSRTYSYKLPKGARKYSGMSPQEALSLLLAYDYINPLLPNKSLDPLKPYLEEARSVLKMNQSVRMRNWKDKVLALNEGFQLSRAKVDSSVVTTIHEALWEGSSIMALYTSSRKKQPSEYHLHPGGLVYRGRISYLICCFDLDPSTIIYLPLHRFSKVTLENKRSVLRNKKVKQLTKDILGFQVSDKRIKIKLKFNQIAGNHLFETPISNNQKISINKEGFVIVEDQVTDDKELRFWIQAFGDNVEVLSPKSLREEFTKLSKSLKKIYD